jgi:SOS-response transcriptional repressor LexA
MRAEKDRIIWDNVEKILKEKDWSLVDLAKHMEMTPQAINSLKKGGIGPRSIKKLSATLNVDEIKLLSIELPPLQPHPIPVISWVHAGEFADCDDRWPPGVSGVEDPVYLYTKTGPNTFGLRVEGDSMLPRFMPGDIAIVDPAVRCDNGSACVVSVNGEVQLRFFWDKETEIILKAMSDKYPEIIIKKDSKVDFKVIGKVIDIKVRYINGVSK